MKHLNKEIIKILDPIMSKKYSAIHKIIKGWVEIIGKEVALKTYPFKVSSNRGKNTLHIVCHSRGLGTELFYQKYVIIEKLELFFGKSYINDLKILTQFGDFEVNNLDFKYKEILKHNCPKHLEEKIFTIDDQTLSDSLLNFANIFINFNQ